MSKDAEDVWLKPMQESVHSVLRRKAGIGRPEPEYGMVSPAKALRLGISKAAQDVLRAPMAAGEIAESRVSLQTMAKVLPDGALCVLLHGPGNARGVVALDRNTVASMLQALTLGRFSEAPIPDRPSTSTDAMLARRFLAELLTVFAASLAGHSAAGWATGFTPRDRIDDLRGLPHLLRDVSYRMFAITVDIGAGLRSGQICVLLPTEGAAGTNGIPAPGLVEPPDWSGRMERMILDSPARLDAVLCRLRLTLSDVAAMQPGDTLRLPARVLYEISLEGASGEQAGTARIGQVDGARAVMLTGVSDLEGSLQPEPQMTGGPGRSGVDVTQPSSAGAPHAKTPVPTITQLTAPVAPDANKDS